MINFKDITESAIHIIECINIGDDIRQDFRLFKDYDVKCYDITYKKWRDILGVPIIVLVGIVFPLTLIIILYRIKKTSKITTKNNIYIFAYCYYSFKENYFFWDIFVLIRKLIIVFFAEYFATDIRDFNITK